MWKRIAKFSLRETLKKVFNACRISISLVSAYFLSYFYASGFNSKLLALLNDYGTLVGFLSGLFIIAGMVDQFVLRELVSFEP